MTIPVQRSRVWVKVHENSRNRIKRLVKIKNPKLMVHELSFVIFRHYLVFNFIKKRIIDKIQNVKKVSKYERFNFKTIMQENVKI